MISDLVFVDVQMNSTSRETVLERAVSPLIPDVPRSTLGQACGEMIGAEEHTRPSEERRRIKRFVVASDWPRPDARSYHLSLTFRATSTRAADEADPVWRVRDDARDLAGFR